MLSPGSRSQGSRGAKQLLHRDLQHPPGKMGREREILRQTSVPRHTVPSPSLQRGPPQRSSPLLIFERSKIKEIFFFGGKQ